MQENLISEAIILETMLSEGATLEIVMKIVSVALFLGLALYAIYMRKNSHPSATSGLHLVSDGFLMVAVLSLVAILPEGTFSPTLTDYITYGTTVGSVIGILFALRGLSQWHSAKQPHQVTIKSATPQRTTQANGGATNEFVRFVDTCLSWSKNTSHLVTPHRLAESFLKLLAESQGLQNSLLALTANENANTTCAPILLATRGIDKKTGQAILSQALASASSTDIKSLTLKRQLQTGSSANIILLSQYDTRFTEKQKTLSRGLKLFGAALKKQSLARQLTQLESNKYITESVQRAFKKALTSNSNDANTPISASSEIKTTQVIFKTIVDTLKNLGADRIPAHFIAVEYSNTESERTVSLSQTFTDNTAVNTKVNNAQPRIGFYPHSRRLQFNASKTAEATLIETLPIYDSRPHRQRITGERLSEIIHGSITNDPQSELVIVIGTKDKNVFGKSQLAVVNQILTELQSLIQYTKQQAPLTSQASERRSSLSDIMQNASPYSRQEQALSLTHTPLTSSTP